MAVADGVWRRQKNRDNCFVIRICLNAFHLSITAAMTNELNEGGEINTDVIIISRRNAYVLTRYLLPKGIVSLSTWVVHMQYTVGARATTHMGLNWARPGVARETNWPTGGYRRRRRRATSKLGHNVYTVTFSLLGQRRRRRKKSKTTTTINKDRGEGETTRRRRFPHACVCTYAIALARNTQRPTAPPLTFTSLTAYTYIGFVTGTVSPCFVHRRRS